MGSDSQTIGAIAERLALEPSTISPVVKRLEAAGFVSRQRNPDEERQVVVSLASKGADLRSRAHELIEAMHQRIGLSAAELASLNQQLQFLRARADGRATERMATADRSRRPDWTKKGG